MRFYLLLSTICILAIGGLHSQPSYTYNDIDSSLVKRLQTSTYFLVTYKVDSASLVLDSLIAEIKDSELADTPFGLRVQLNKALTLERDNAGDLALIQLQNLKERAFQSKVWDVYANAAINLALVYEKIGKYKDCIQNLREAQKVLQRHPELEYIYPHFYVRISSYHRVFDNRDSAIYYAQECLRSYKKFEDETQGGDGYMLMTLLTDSDNIEQRMEYAKSATRIYSKLKNHNALGYMALTISNMYLSIGDYQKALTYNDTTILAAKKYVNEGFDDYHALYTAYKYRGEILSKMKQFDSSSFYIKKGYELHNQQIQTENINKVLEMDAKYKDDKKAQTIKEQEEQLKSAQERRKLMMIIFWLVVLFASGLIYYYNKLSIAKKQTELQAEQIKRKNKELSKSLERQITLQGEVHHRVKNNLQVIISLLELHKDELKDQESKNNIDSMSKRIYSMAAIHNLLYLKEEMEFIKLHEYVENLCYHFSNFSLEQNKPEYDLKIEDINLNLETSMPIGIIITELLNNSLKYARVKGQKLKIQIDIFRKQEGILIKYKDNGPGFEKEEDYKKPNGLGFYILESMARQLQGKLIRKNDNGANYEIFIVEKNVWNDDSMHP